jgi:uncharacterized protein YvpB
VTLNPGKNAADISLLLQQVEGAVRQGRDSAARRLLHEILRHDPTHADALLWMVYVAEDGPSSLVYLARLLDVHPRHPQAKQAIRWARRRLPTSSPRQAPPRSAISRSPRSHARFLVYGLAVLTVFAGMGVAWTITLPQPPLGPIHANASPTRPTPAPGQFMEIIRVSIPLFTVTPTPPPTPTPTPTPIPSRAMVPLLGQPQTYNMSCESRSAADLAAHWSIEIDETDFFNALGYSDNPHQGFVGDVDAPPGSLPPYGYGVYAEPVAATLRNFGLDAQPAYNLGLDGLKAELLAGRPVLVWATYGMTLYEPQEWVSQDGQSSTVVPFMHTFLVTGYDEEGLFVLDAYDATTQHYPFDTFLEVWNIFNQMAVIAAGPSP